MVSPFIEFGGLRGFALPFILDKPRVFGDIHDNHVQNISQYSKVCNILHIVGNVQNIAQPSRLVGAELPMDHWQVNH